MTTYDDCDDECVVTNERERLFEREGVEKKVGVLDLALFQILR